MPVVLRGMSIASGSDMACRTAATSRKPFFCHSASAQRKPRHLERNGRLNAPSVFDRDTITEIIKSFMHGIPEAAALGVDLDSAFRDAGQHRDVLLSWLAVDTDVLNQNRLPVHVRPASAVGALARAQDTAALVAHDLALIVPNFIAPATRRGLAPSALPSHIGVVYQFGGRASNWCTTRFALHVDNLYVVSMKPLPQIFALQADRRQSSSCRRLDDHALPGGRTFERRELRAADMAPAPARRPRESKPKRNLRRSPCMPAA
jgi:hypothetical protein